MSDSVIITAIICFTIVIVAYIGMIEGGNKNGKK